MVRQLEVSNSQKLSAALGLKGWQEKEVLSEHRGWGQSEGARTKEGDFQGAGTTEAGSVWGGGEQETS